MISFICRARKHVGNAAADDRSDDAEHDCPENRYVHVHHRFRDDARDEPNKHIPDQVKHTFYPSFRNGLSTKSRTFEKISNGGALPNGGGSHQRSCGMCVPYSFGTELGSRGCRFTSSEFFDPTAGDTCSVVAREC
jgi:hypothetical protein